MALKSVLTWRKPRQLDLEEYFTKLKAKGLNQDGSPILDPTPMAPPIGYKKHPSMVELMRDMIRSEKLAQAARESGHETFEEAEDFNIGDEPELARSPYENEFEPDLQEILKVGAEELKKRKAAEIAAATSVAPRSDSPPVAEKPVSVPPSDGRAGPAK